MSSKEVLARPRKGLSLVEVMIGVTIFAFAVIPIIGLFGRSTTFTQSNADHLAAMHSASGYLRSLLGLPFRDIPLGSPVSLDQTFGSDATNQVYIPSTASINGNTFSYRLRSRNVTRDADGKDLWFSTMVEPGVTQNFSTHKRFIRIEMEVSWKSKMSGEKETIKLFIYKADLG
jgi:hypothetical protein